MDHTIIQKEEKLIVRFMKRCPAWLYLDYSRIGTLDDLRFQMEHELDLYNEGDHHASITTKARAHQLKMLLADVCIAIINLAAEVK